MSEPLVSVIVPIYKVEQYLVRCLDSIVHQHYVPMEVILIDDGSPDGCGEIIHRYAAQYPFIRSVWQENRGLSAARNVGIAMATGKYLALIDSDDYVEPDFISNLVAVAEREQADVVVCNFFLDFTNGSQIPFPLMTLQTSLSGEEAAQISLNLLRLPVFAWNKLYRTGLFTENNIKYPSISYEDVATTPKVLMRARKVSVTQKPYYHYCVRRNSITGSFGVKNIADYLEAVESIRTFIVNEGLWKPWQKSYRHFLRTVHAYLLLEVTLQEGTIPAGSRRDLLREINLRLQKLRLPPGPDQQAPTSSTGNQGEDTRLGD